MVSVDSLETTETVQTDSIVAATRPLPAPMMTADCKPVLRLDIVFVGGVELAEQFGEDIAHSVEKSLLVAGISKTV